MFVCLVSLDPGEQSIEADSQLNRSKARLKKIQSHSSVTFSFSDTVVVVIQSIYFEFKRKKWLTWILALDNAKRQKSTPQSTMFNFCHKRPNSRLGKWDKGGSMRRRRYNAPASQLSRFGEGGETTNCFSHRIFAQNFRPNIVPQNSVDPEMLVPKHCVGYLTKGLVGSDKCSCLSACPPLSPPPACHTLSNEIPHQHTNTDTETRTSAFNMNCIDTDSHL